jgi:hypothetical protein
VKFLKISIQINTSGGGVYFVLMYFLKRKKEPDPEDEQNASAQRFAV